MSAKVQPIAKHINGKAQLENGVIIDVSDHSVGYGVEGISTMPIQQPYSNWHPILPKNKQVKSIKTTNIPEKDSTDPGPGPGPGTGDPYPRIMYLIFEWRVLNPANLTSFWSNQGHLLELNCASPYIATYQLQYGVSGWGRMFQMIDESSGFINKRMPVSPIEDFFQKTLGEDAQSTVNNNGYTEEDWWYFTEDISHLNMHIEGPVDSEYWDYGPKVNGKFYVLYPPPAKWETYTPFYNERFLFIIQLLGMANTSVISNNRTEGEYTAEETWSFYSEEVEKTYIDEGGIEQTCEVTEFVFKMEFSSSSTYRAYGGDRTWPLTSVIFELRSHALFQPFCILFQNKLIRKNALTLDGDPIIINYHQVVDENYVSILTQTASCVDGEIEKDHYLGVTLENNSYITQYDHYPVVIGVLTPETEHDILINKALGKNADSHIIGNDNLSIVLWEESTGLTDYSSRDSTRMYFFDQSIYEESMMNPDSTVLRKTHNNPTIIWNEKPLVYLYPPTHTWDAFDHFIEVNGYGDFAGTPVDLVKRTGLHLDVVKDAARYQEGHPDYYTLSYTLSDPGDSRSTRIFDTYDATLQVLIKDGKLHIWAGLGSIDEYDPDSDDENPYPIVITYEGFKEADVIDPEGNQGSSFYFSGETKVVSNYYRTLSYRTFYVIGAQCYIRLIPVYYAN